MSNHAGVLSVLGMVVAKPGRQSTGTPGKVIQSINNQFIEDAIDGLRQQALAALEQQGNPVNQARISVVLDICYQSQAHMLEIPWSSITHCMQQFEQAHRQRYGYSLIAEIELVNIRGGVTLANKVGALVNSVLIESEVEAVIDNGVIDRSQITPRHEAGRPTLHLRCWYKGLAGNELAGESRYVRTLVAELCRQRKITIRSKHVYGFIFIIMVGLYPRYTYIYAYHYRFSDALSAPMSSTSSTGTASRHQSFFSILAMANNRYGHPGMGRGSS